MSVGNGERHLKATLSGAERREVGFIDFRFLRHRAAAESFYLLSGGDYPCHGTGFYTQNRHSIAGHIGSFAEQHHYIGSGRNDCLQSAVEFRTRGGIESYIGIVEYQNVGPFYERIDNEKLAQFSARKIVHPF